MIAEAVIFVIIPTYNAEKTIAGVLSGIPEFVDQVIVIDDCSLDNTSNIVRNFQHNDPRVTLLRHEQNQGVGGALLSGYRLALDKNAAIIVKMDSDGQMDPAYMDQLISPILSGESDYTKGNRFLHEKELRHMPYIRRIGNLGLSFLTKVASGYWNIFDPTNGYTAIGSNALRSLDFRRLSKRYFFETSMLLELGLQRLVVKDIYIPAIYGDESSKLSNLKALFEFPPKLFLGMLRRIIFLYFIRDLTAVSIFSIAGIVSVIFGSLWGIYHWWRSSVTGVEASTGTVMIAILPLILGIQFLLQAVGMDIQNTPQKDGWGR